MFLIPTDLAVSIILADWSIPVMEKFRSDYINPEGTILDIGCGTGLPITKYVIMC